MAENNIIIKITGEADLDAAQKQMQELTARAKEQERALQELSDQEKEDAKSIKALGLEEERLAKRLKENKRFYQDLREQKKGDIASTKQSIKALQDQVKSYKTLHGQSGRMVMQLRAMREELQRMEDSGQFGTKAFTDLAIAAGQLEDQIGDTQQRIRILSSDTQGLDAVMSAGDGLAGSFYIATSAAEVFGDDMEGLQQAFYKVQAAISIVSGTQQVWNALNKESAINVVLGTKLSNLDAVAKAKQAVAAGTATVAQRALNAAMKANPMGVILTVMTALVGVFMLFSDKIEVFGKRMRNAFDGFLGKISKSYKHASDLKRTLEELERVSTITGKALDNWAIVNEQNLAKLSKAEANEMNAAKKRHASSLEMNKIELKYLEKRRDVAIDYANKAIPTIQKEIDLQKRAIEDQKKRVKDFAAGSSKRLEEEKKLADMETQYYDLVREQMSLDEMRTSAKQAVTEKEQEIADLRISMEKEAQQGIINAMREGKEKELAQLELNYKEEQLAAKGNNKLLTALKDKYEKDKADIEKNWANRTNEALVERLRLESEADRTNLDKKEQFYRAEAEAKVQALDKMKMTEQEYENAVTEIYTDLDNNLTSLDEERANRLIQSYSTSLAKAEDEVEKARAGGGGVLTALQERLDAQTALYDAQAEQLEAQYRAGLITFEDYEQQKWEITKATTDARVQYELDSMQAISDGFQTALGYIQEASDLAFEAINNNIQAQMDALDEEYTTDWEEAQKNAKKKYITEEEYEKKKAALEMKQAKFAKAQAMTNIAIQTALSIITTLAQLGATPWGIAAAAIAGSMGAAQLAIAAAKPLAQYEKGRKGGPGEYALVGEKGPEIMYIPRGASIIPNNKIDNPAAWAQFGVPELPHANPDTLHYASEHGAFGQSIDYERLGAAVAAAMPKQRNVTVNVDRSGVHVSNGSSKHTYLNTKYNGVWN